MWFGSLIFVRLSQSRKLSKPIYWTLLGIVICVSFFKFLKTQSPMLSKPSCNNMQERFSQPSKAQSSMLLTPAGIVILVRFVQPEKALSPMHSKLSGSIILVRLSQPSKVPYSPSKTRIPSGSFRQVIFLLS